jgi:uncharacterized protein YwbE
MIGVHATVDTKTGKVEREEVDEVITKESLSPAPRDIANELDALILKLKKLGINV